MGALRCSVSLPVDSRLSKARDMRSSLSGAMFLLLAGLSLLPAAEKSLSDQARAAIERGVQFYHSRVSTHGGYVYLYSSDLSRREGEGKTTPETLWVQPPGTPAVGEAFLLAYERTGSPTALEAAKDAAECLLQGQYRSGGWNASIEFDPAERAKHAYRVDRPLPKKRQRNISSLDDDKTQSALRFLMHLDRALDFKDQSLHEATRFALDALLAAQYPNGAWAQVWEDPIDSTTPADVRASYPADWPRQYPGGDYWWHYTLNDDNLLNVARTLIVAEEVYGEERARTALSRLGDFLILAQMPEPQPAWAQQYDRQMHPVWARKFEPPAISGRESQGALETLMLIAQRTGDKRFLDPVPKALTYLERSQLPDGKFARFYELRSNHPLYMTRDYQLTESPDDLPTHYAFIIDNKLPKLRVLYAKLTATPLKPVSLGQSARPKWPEPAKLERQVREILEKQDSRGAWVEPGKLSYHGKGDTTREVISSETFIKNLDLLSSYVAAATPGR